MFMRNAQQAILLHREMRVSFSWAQVRRVLLSLTAVIAVIVLLVWLQNPSTLPIRKIQALGTFEHVNDAMLRRAVADAIDGGFFSVDVARVKQVVEAIPWVDKASVRRVWPDMLAITISEQHALARWRDGGLINRRGEIFSPDLSTQSFDQLPMFSGPVGMQQQLTDYYQFAQPLFMEQGLQITALELDARRALRLRLQNGIEVMVGREQIRPRLQRLAKVYQPGLADRAVEIARIDLRYSNGFAIGWRKPPVDE